MEETNWLPALIALAAGLAGGAIFMLRSSGKGGRELFSQLDHQDLQARFDLLIDRLRAARAGGAAVSSAGTLELEIEAARVLRELESTAPPVIEAPKVEAAPQGGIPLPAKALLWITGIASAAAVTYVLLITSMIARPEGAPLTGDLSLTGAPPAAAEQQLRERVMADPRDVEARLALARGMLDEGRMIEVWEQTEAVLAQNPDNGRALAYQSLVLLSIGNSEAAEATARKAVTAEPKMVEPWVHLALVHFQQGKLEEALGDLARAKSVSPADAPLIDRLAAEMRGGAGTAAADSRFAGNIELSPAVASQYRGATIFVVVRDASSPAGPPAAAARLSVTGTHIPFSISDGDSMTGAPIPASARLEFRIDTDGDPLTRNDGPSAAVAAEAGATNLEVKLGS